jgi:hypothetical protein
MNICMLNLLIDPWRLAVLGAVVTCFGEMETDVQGSDTLDLHSRFSAALEDGLFFYSVYQIMSAV